MIWKFFTLFVLTVSTITGHSQSVKWNAIDLSRKGDHISVTNESGEIYILTFPDCAFKKKIHLDSTFTTQTTWNPSTDLLATSGYSMSATSPYTNILLYDLKKDSTFTAGNNLDGGKHLTWSTDGKLLALAGMVMGYAMIFNDQWEKIKHFSHPSKKRLSSVALHPVKNELAAAETDVRIFDLDSNKETARLRNGNFRKNILCLAWNPDGTLLAGGDEGHETDNENSYLTIWDSTGNPIVRVRDSAEPYNDLEWSPDGKEIATASDALRIWSPGGKLLEKVNFNTPLKGLAWSPDGKKIVVCGDDLMVGVWNRKSKKVLLKKEKL